MTVKEVSVSNIKSMRLTVTLEVETPGMVKTSWGQPFWPTEVVVTYWAANGIKAVPEIVIHGYPTLPADSRKRLHFKPLVPERWPAWVREIVIENEPAWHRTRNRRD